MSLAVGDIAIYKGVRVRVRVLTPGSKRAVVIRVDDDGKAVLLPFGVPRKKLKSP